MRIPLLSAWHSGESYVSHGPGLLQEFVTRALSSWACSLYSRLLSRSVCRGTSALRVVELIPLFLRSQYVGIIMAKILRSTKWKRPLPLLDEADTQGEVFVSGNLLPRAVPKDTIPA